MPIELSFEVRRLDQEEFHALDRKLMRIVFDVHNQLGRFLDEVIYKREVARRWETAGLGSAQCEAEITVSHQSFVKNYYIDMLLNQGLIVEMKTAESLVAIHRAQGLNYLFLTGLQHGRLVNMRPAKVEHEFLSTQLTTAKRRRFEIHDSAWQLVSPQSGWLRETVVELLDDWGAFLEVALYRDAVTHLRGGADSVVRPIPVSYLGNNLGTQTMHLLDEDVAFAFTAVTADHEPMVDHQRRLLRHMPLRAIQWINFNHHQIEFNTIQRPSRL